MIPYLYKTFFLIVLISCTFTSLAQSLPELQKQLKRVNSDKDKIYALDALANYYTWTEGGYTDAQVYGQQMISAAEKTSNKELLAMAYVLNGIRLTEALPSTEREKELRGYYAKAIQIAKDNNLPFYEAAAYIGLSGIQFHTVSADPDEMLGWGTQAARLATSISNDSLQTMAVVAVAIGYKLKKNNTLAFRKFSEALQLAERLDDPFLLSYCYRSFARFYHDLTGEYDKALVHYANAMASLQKKKTLTFRDKNWMYWTQINTTWAYKNKHDLRNAWASVNKLNEIALQYNLPGTYKVAPLYQELSLYVEEGKFREAIVLFKQNQNLEAFFKNHDFENALYRQKASLYKNINQADSADHYYKLSLAAIAKSVPAWSAEVYVDYGNFLLERRKLSEAIKQFENAEIKSREFKNLKGLVASYEGLDKAYYQVGNITKAYIYKSLYIQFKDSLNKLNQGKELALLEVQQEQKRMDQEQQQKQAIADYRNRIRTIGLITGLATVLLAAAVLWRNNRQKQKANLLLQKQKRQTELQKVKVEQTLEELKVTQAQLIQSEKMASLGELTAGIAHEIQNPLNFVNNFSEVNKEMIAEMKEEIDKGNYEDVKLIANDIEENEEKIIRHGKRADAIVKGMLQHSRVSTGQKEPTDINKLADEYVRLSYHGMRAKDKSFNSTLQTDFDKSIDKINVVPQDIGRVLLNLFNNAFYAVVQKKKNAGDSYEPTVSVSTKKLDGKIEIRVQDNGTGIPQNTVDKIFQPFFTTKPTGQGTGLGLSLSYDIIKAHGGEIKVETKEGEGAEFVIQISNA